MVRIALGALSQLVLICHLGRHDERCGYETWMNVLEDAYVRAHGC